MKQFLLLLLTFVLFSHCQKEEITLSVNASDVFYLQNHGASMPIRVHGNTASKTFMIMVHGGPGGDAIVYRTSYVKENLEPKFAVVYWDQRNSGATQGGFNLAHDQVDDFVNDFEKVVALLKYRYGADISLFVNGHSWGGYLTPAFLQKGNNQQSVKGWIQTAGAHNIPLLNAYSLQMQLDKANIEISAGRNVMQWEKIRDFCYTVSLPATVQESLKLNQNSVQAERLTPEVPKSGYTGGIILANYLENHAPLSQLYFQLGVNPVLSSLSSDLFNGAQVSDHMDLITVPTLLLFGKYDYTCPAGLADDIEVRIQSAYQKKVIFENSGHSIMLGADEKAYWDEVTAFIEQFR